jgi:hypothetical protein
MISAAESQKETGRSMLLYFDSCAWLISHSVLSSGFIHVVTNDRISFLWLNRILLYHIFFIQSFMRRYTFLHLFLLLYFFRGGH